MGMILFPGLCRFDSGAEQRQQNRNRTASPEMFGAAERLNGAQMFFRTEQDRSAGSADFLSGQGEEIRPDLPRVQMDLADGLHGVAQQQGFRRMPIQQTADLTEVHDPAGFALHVMDRQGGGPVRKMRFQVGQGDAVPVRFAEDQLHSILRN